MRRRERERFDALCEARDLVRSGNWLVLDVETTSLEGEIIQWAVAAPDGTILGQGFVQPTRPITEGARAVHGIPDALVADAPTFAEMWPTLWSLLAGKTVVAYNASFEEARLYTSAAPYFSFLRGEPNLRWFCAMEAFAAASGAWSLAATQQVVIDLQRLITGHIVTTATTALTGRPAGETLVELAPAGEAGRQDGAQPEEVAASNGHRPFRRQH